MGRRQRIKARERARRVLNTDVERHAENVARETAEFGGAVEKVSDDSLFVIDVKGDSGAGGVSGPRKRGRALLEAPSRADEILTVPERSAVPAHVNVQRKKRKVENRGEKGGKKGGGGEQEAGKPKRKVPRNPAPVRKVKPVVTVGPRDVGEDNFDLWGTEAEAKLFPEPKPAVANVPRVKPMRMAPGLSVPVTSQPAVALRGSGYSYNPSKEALKEATLEEAAKIADQELRKARGEAHVAELRRTIVANKKARNATQFTITDVDGIEEWTKGGIGGGFAALANIRERTAREYLSDDESDDDVDGDDGDDAASGAKGNKSGENGDSDGSDGSDSDDMDTDGEGASAAAGRAKPGTDGVRLTKAQRNRQKERKDKERDAAERRRRERDEKEVNILGTHLKAVRREQRASEEAARRTEEKKKMLLGLPNKNIAKHRLEDTDVHLHLEEELPGKLRNATTAGNLLRDRFVSILARNMVEPRAKVAKKKGRNKVVTTVGSKGNAVKDMHAKRESAKHAKKKGRA